MNKKIKIFVRGRWRAVYSRDYKDTKAGTKITGGSLGKDVKYFDLENIKDLTRTTIKNISKARNIPERVLKVVVNLEFLQGHYFEVGDEDD